MSHRPSIHWDVRRHGRRWTRDEFDARLAWTPEKIEFVGGLFTSDDERRIVLGMLLENLGIDAALKFGRAADWEAAVAARRDAEAREDDAQNP